MRNQRNTYVYTAFTQNYKYSTVMIGLAILVYAMSVKQARQHGYREALAVMGKCAVIQRDLVEPQK